MPWGSVGGSSGAAGGTLGVIGAATVNAPTYEEIILGLGPWAYWKLDETSGVYLDQSGNNRNGTIVSGVTRGVAGPMGDLAAEFAGSAAGTTGISSTGITVGSIFTLTSDWSVTGWMRQTSGRELSFMLGTNTDGGATAPYWSINNRYGAALMSQSRASSTTTQMPTSGPFMAADSVWHHFAVIRWGSVILNYIDGILVSTASVAAPPSGMTSLTIGRILSHLDTYAFNGRLSHLAVHQAALTHHQILDLYSAGVPGLSRVDEVLYDQPLGLWKMDNGAGAPTDSVGSNHLTTTGGSSTYNSDGLFGTVIDGADGYWTCPIRCPQASYTMEAWVKVGTLSGDSTVMGDWGGTASNGAMLIIPTGTNQIRAYHKSNFLTGPAFPANTWHHVAATWDGFTQRLYVDGTLYASRTETGAPGTAAGSGSASFVSMHGAPVGGETTSRRFDGNLAMVAWYDHAVSAGRIRRHFLSTWGAGVHLYDDFTRPNTAAGMTSPVLGGNWVEVNGSWGVVDGILYLVSGVTNETSIVTADAGTSDFYAQWVCGAADRGYGGPIFRGDALGNGLTLRDSSVNSNIILYDYSHPAGSTPISTISTSGPFTTGDVIGVKCQGTTITAYKNGSQIGSATGVTNRQTSTYVGFVKYAAVGHTTNPRLNSILVTTA